MLAVDIIICEMETLVVPTSQEFNECREQCLTRVKYVIMLAAIGVIIGIGKEVPAAQDAWSCGLKNSLDVPWAVQRQSGGFRESRYFPTLAAHRNSRFRTDSGVPGSQSEEACGSCSPRTEWGQIWWVGMLTPCLPFPDLRSESGFGARTAAWSRSWAP